MANVGYRSYSNYRYTRPTGMAETVIFDNLEYAQELLNKFESLIKEKGHVSLAYYYELTGGKVCEEDSEWGWTDLLGCNISICRYGYELHMPMTKVINVDPKEEIIDMLHDALNQDDMGIVSDAIDRLGEIR